MTANPSSSPEPGLERASRQGGAWLSDIVVPVLIAVLRVAWLAPWLELVRRWLAPSSAGPLLPAWLLLAVLLSAAACARLLARSASLTVARLLQALAGFVALVLLVWWQFFSAGYALWATTWLSELWRRLVGWESELPAVLLALPVLIYLWLQGTLDGSPAEREDAWGAFAGGFVALALCAVAALLDGRGLPPGMETTVFVFFTAGMAALALASLVSARSAAVRSGDGQIAVSRYWLASVASVIAVLLLAGLLLSLLISPAVIARALSWTSAILNLLGTLLYYVLLVFAYLVFSLLSPLLNMFNGQPRQPAQSSQSDSYNFTEQFKELQQGNVSAPPRVLDLLPWLGLALVVLIIALAFALALRRLQRPASDDVDETREIILSRGLLGAQLAGLRNGLRRARGAAAPLLNPFLSLDGEAEPRRRIRAIYQAFLSAMQLGGHERQPGQTPAEYKETARTVLPDAAAALDTVTTAYEQARYAAQAPTTAAADRTDKAWSQIESTLKATKNE